MRIVLPDRDRPLDPEWRQPLTDAAVVVATLEHWSFQFFDPDDFTVMGRIDRRPRPSILLYKHCDTRKYLNLDATGLAYRYSAPKTLKGSGRYLRQPNFHSAIRSLDLWELPWMRPELESFCRGVSWEERWRVLLPELDVDPPVACHEPEGGRARGHLRLV